MVVPTRDRPAHLNALMAGLRAQTLAAERFEVLVIDDSAGRGQAAARNQGWRSAQAPLVAFTDDDCVPAPGWLAEGLAASRAHPGAIVQGRTEPARALRSPFERTVSVHRLGPQYQTCNIFYPRALLERLRGFDEGLAPPVTGEDTELAWRALESGASAVFAPEALVLHAVHELGPLRMLAEAGRWSDVARVFARHPGARVMLNRGVFWNGWHYCLVRSALALALPRPVRRLLLMRHAAQLGARAREAGAGPWAVPFLLAYDALELAAIARGAIRHRTLVL